MFAPVAQRLVEGMPQDPVGRLITPHASRVAGFKDPNGNTQSLAQLRSRPTIPAWPRLRSRTPA